MTPQTMPSETEIRANRVEDARKRADGAAQRPGHARVTKSAALPAPNRDRAGGA